MTTLDKFTIAIILVVFLVYISLAETVGRSFGFGYAFFLGLFAVFNVLIVLNAWDNYNNKKDDDLVKLKESAPPLTLPPLHQNPRPLLKNDSGPLDF